MRAESSAAEHLGVDKSKKLLVRIAALRAADSLLVFWPPHSGPERCHELKEGIFSFDLNEPYRLLFRPVGVDPMGGRTGERAQWSSISQVELVGIENVPG